MQHRADGIHTATHFIAAGVELPFFNNVVTQHLTAWNVGILNHVFRRLFGAALGVSVENVEAVEHVADLILVSVGKHFATVEPLIHRDVAVSHMAHDDVEQAFAIFIWFFGIIERRVLALGEVDLTIHDFHPLQVGIAWLRHLVERLLTR